MRHLKDILILMPHVDFLSYYADIYVTIWKDLSLKLDHRDQGDLARSE